MRNHLLTLALAVILCWLMVQATMQQIGKFLPEHNQKETAYERVIRTGVIRCAYMNWPPTISKDPNTGEYSGIMVDYMNALADSLGLKVEWTEELNLSTYIQDLNNSKYDMECSGGWPNASRGKELNYSTPIYYFPVVSVARADDLRFDGNLQAIDDSAIRIATIDGETSDVIRTRRFPKSQAVGLPSLSPPSDLLMQISSGKADVTFNDLPSVMNFMQSNPGKIKIIDAPPARIIPNNVSFAKNEFQLQQMVNVATQELIHDGVVDRILSKHETVPGAFLRIAQPYQLPTPK